MMRYCGGGIGHLGTICCNSAIPLAVNPQGSSRSTFTHPPLPLAPQPQDDNTRESSSSDEEQDDDDYVDEGADGEGDYDLQRYHY